MNNLIFSAIIKYLRKPIHHVVNVGATNHTIISAMSLYSPGSLLREKYGGKQIWYIDKAAMPLTVLGYIVMNVVRRPVRSMKVFFRNNWDVDDVMAVSGTYLDLIPVGDVMT
jgi:hypothetical protein